MKGENGMKRNALFPYLLIGVFGIGLVIALSLIGLYQGNEEAGGEEGGKCRTCNS